MIPACRRLEQQGCSSGTARKASTCIVYEQVAWVFERVKPAMDDDVAAACTCRWRRHRRLMWFDETSCGCRSTTSRMTTSRDPARRNRTQRVHVGPVVGSRPGPGPGMTSTLGTTVGVPAIRGRNGHFGLAGNVGHQRYGVRLTARGEGWIRTLTMTTIWVTRVSAGLG